MGRPCGWHLRTDGDVQHRRLAGRQHQGRRAERTGGGAAHLDHVGLRRVDLGEPVPALRIGDGALRGLRRVLRRPEQDHLDAAQRGRRSGR